MIIEQNCLLYLYFQEEFTGSNPVNETFNLIWSENVYLGSCDRLFLSHMANNTTQRADVITVICYAITHSRDNYVFLMQELIWMHIFKYSMSDKGLGTRLICKGSWLVRGDHTWWHGLGRNERCCLKFVNLFRNWITRTTFIFQKYLKSSPKMTAPYSVLVTRHTG